MNCNDKLPEGEPMRAPAEITPENPSLSDNETQQFLTFRVGAEEYGVGIMAVREVKGWSSTTRLPNTPEYLRGVLNLRGSIIPIFDLRARFGGPLTEATDKHVIVILNVDSRTIGLLVDSVSDILTVESCEIRSAPASHDTADSRFIAGLIGIESRMVVLLHIPRLVDISATFEQMDEIQ